MKKNLHLQFETEINYKNQKIDELKKDLEEFRTIIKNNNKDKNDSIERIITINKQEMEELRTKYEVKI